MHLQKSVSEPILLIVFKFSSISNFSEIGKLYLATSQYLATGFKLWGSQWELSSYKEGVLIRLRMQ